jgi:hypothetical protein
VEVNDSAESFAPLASEKEASIANDGAPSNDIDCPKEDERFN